MKISLRKNGGNVLFGVLFVTGIICLYMGSYLTLVRSENQITRRSLAWNMAIPIAEAGIEEALTQIQYNYPDLKENNGWLKINDRYFWKTNRLNENQYYTVGIFIPGSLNGNTNPVIVSQGFVRPPSQTNFISRTIRVKTKLDGYVMPGMVVVETAKLSGGSKMTVDSYNSTNSAYSTDGKYDSSKRGDKAYLATLSTKTNAVDLGNTQVWGKVASGHNGVPPTLGTQSSVGDKAWHDAGKKGLQPGAYSDDVNISIEPVEPPVNGLPLPTNASGVYVLGDATYAADNLSGTVLVTGKARLLVTKTFNVSSLTISNATGTASLELYVAAQDVNLSGNGQLNVQGRPSNFKYFGLPANPDKNWTGNKTLVAGGNGQFNAMVYAPYTDLSMQGGGNSDQDFSGAALVKNVTINGHYSFHFDESCLLEMARGYIAISWDEISVSWDQILASNLAATDLR